MKELFIVFCNFPPPTLLNPFAKLILILYDLSVAIYIVVHSIFLDTFFAFKYIAFHGFLTIIVVTSSQLLFLYPSSILKCWSIPGLSLWVSKSTLPILILFMLSIPMVYYMLTPLILISLVWSSTLNSRFKSNCLLNISIWVSIEYLKVSIPYLSPINIFLSPYHIHNGNSMYSVFQTHNLEVINFFLYLIHTQFDAIFNTCSESDHFTLPPLLSFWSKLSSFLIYLFIYLLFFFKFFID